MTVFTTDPYAIVQTAGETYIGDGTDQVYSINPAMIQAGEVVTIIDQGGTNAIELNAGLEITESIVSNNELVLTLSNGAIVNVRGADTFTFNVGQNQAGGDNEGTELEFADFAQDILGVTLPAEGEAPVEGGASTVNDDGTADVTPVGTPSLSIDDVSVTEGDADTTTATFTVTLSEAPGAGETVTVDYATEDGTATAGDDYVAATGSLTFAEGETTQTIEVTVNGDTEFEADETFNVVLDESSIVGTIGGEAVVISDGTGAGTITNDDEEAVAGETITLTTGNDVVGPDGAEGFATTVGDDTIEGVSSTLSSARTLNADDSIDGGDGADTLTVDMQGNFGGFSEDGGLANVETVDLTNGGSIARIFNATGVTGVQEYVLNNGNAATNLADLMTADAEVTVNNQEDSNLAIAFDTDSDVVTGTADVLNMNLNSVGVADDPDTTADEEQVVTMTADNIEELALTTTGDNVVDLGSDDAETITVTGEGSLKIADVGTGLGVFDAAGYAGDVDVDLDATADATLVALGSGDDTLAIDAADDVTKNAELTGGDGADTLEVTASAANTVQYNVSGFETLNFANTNALTFSAVNASDIETIQASEDQTADVTFASLGTGDYTVELLGANANTPVLTLDHSGATTLNVSSPANTATVDAPSANDVGVTLNNSASVDMTVDTKMSYQGTVTATKATSVEMDIQGETTGATVAAAAATGVVISAVENDSDMTLTAANATDLNVTADADLDLTAFTLTSLESLNANTKGFLDLSASPLAAVASVALEGIGSVELNNLGGVDQDGYGISLTATGLGSDEATGTQSLVVGQIHTEGQNITVDAGGVLGAATFGIINANNGATTAGDVSIDLAGIGDDFTLGTVQGKNVTINAAGALGGSTYGAVTLTESGTLDFTGVGLDTNAITAITNAAASAKDVSMTFVGGIDNDTFTVQTAASFTGDVTIDVTGDLQATGGADTLELDAATNTVALNIDSLAMSGIEVVEINGDVTVKGADISGETFDLDGTAATQVLTVTGTSSVDTIDLSNIESIGITNAASINVQGSDSADTITASDAADIFTYTADTQLGDTINSFASGTDAINLDIGGAATTTGAGSKYSSAGDLFTKATSFAGTAVGVKLLIATDAAAAKGAVATTTLATVGASKVFTVKMLMTGLTGASATAVAGGLNSWGTAAGFVTNANTFAAFATTTGGKLLVAMIKNTAGTTVAATEVVSVQTIGTFDAAVAFGDIVLT